MVGVDKVEREVVSVLKVRKLVEVRDRPIEVADVPRHRIVCRDRKILAVADNWTAPLDRPLHVY